MQYKRESRNIRHRMHKNYEKTEEIVEANQVTVQAIIFR